MKEPGLRVEVISLDGLVGAKRACLDRFLQMDIQANTYHLPEWLEIIRDVYRYDPYYVLQWEQDACVGLLPFCRLSGVVKKQRLVSLPFSHYVPPLCRTPADLSLMLSKVIECLASTGARYLELKSGVPDAGDSLQRNVQYFNTVLDLRRSLDTIWKGFDPKRVRWAIGKAGKGPLRIDASNGRAQYQAFYRLELETRKRQGAPPYAPQFFEQLYERLGRAGNAQCLLACIGDRPVAGIIVLYHGVRAIYGYGASVSNREDLAHQPNHLLVWTAIQAAHQRGCETFDFGTTPLHHKGLLKFKEGWGGMTERLAYSYYPPDRKSPTVNRESGAVKALSWVLGNTPLPILARIGPPILRQLG